MCALLCDSILLIENGCVSTILSYFKMFYLCITFVVSTKKAFFVKLLLFFVLFELRFKGQANNVAVTSRQREKNGDRTDVSINNNRLLARYARPPPSWGIWQTYPILKINHCRIECKMFALCIWWPKRVTACYICYLH